MSLFKNIKKEEVLIGVSVAMLVYVITDRFIFKKESESKDDTTLKPLRLNDKDVKLREFPSDEELVSKFKDIAGVDYNDYIKSIKQVPLEPIVAIRQLYAESSFSPNVINCSRVSSAGAKGIAQFMPGTWPSYSNGNPCNVSDSLKAHAKMMKDLMTKFPNRPDLALSGYNSGPNIKFKTGENTGKYIYNYALKNNLKFNDLKNVIPNESYKYTLNILRP